MPKRIQRKRTKGWKMPPGAVYVGRPTIWGNPWSVEKYGRDEAVRMYRDEIMHDLPGALTQLRGRDLACWCRLDQVCHADVLIELANR